MPKYFYRATVLDGTVVDGRVDAESIEQARSQLETEGLVIQYIREHKSSVWSQGISLHVSVHDIAFFTKNFSVMMGAGLTVVDSLIIAEAQANGRLKKILQSILQRVESGHSLADALAKHKRYFPGTYVDVIRNGELSGTLSDSMEKLSDRLESDLSLRRKIKAALVYPVIVIVAIILLTSILSIYVLPRLTRLFLSLDVELPASTRFLLWVSEFLVQYWILILIVLAVVIIAVRFLLIIPAMRKLWHRLLLHLPVIGDISRNVHLARFAGTLGSLLKSGVPIAESFDSVIHSASNEIYRDRLREALHHIERGGSLADFLEGHRRMFPATVTRMISVGERTGRLDDILIYLGKYYEVEVDSSTKQLSTTLEPIILIIIGAVVLFVGLSVITPIYQFTASVGQI